MIGDDGRVRLQKMPYVHQGRGIYTIDVNKYKERVVNRIEVENDRRSVWNGIEDRKRVKIEQGTAYVGRTRLRTARRGHWS